MVVSWHRNNETENALKSRRWYGLVVVMAIVRASLAPVEILLLCSLMLLGYCYD